MITHGGLIHGGNCKKGFTVILSRDENGWWALQCTGYCKHKVVVPDRLVPSSIKVGIRLSAASAS